MTQTHQGWTIAATAQHGNYGWLIIKVQPGIKALLHSQKDNFPTPEAAVKAAIEHINQNHP